MGRAIQGAVGSVIRPEIASWTGPETGAETGFYRSEPVADVRKGVTST
jgi:hypothetical protein